MGKLRGRQTWWVSPARCRQLPGTAVQSLAAADWPGLGTAQPRQTTELWPQPRRHSRGCVQPRLPAGANCAVQVPPQSRTQTVPNARRGCHEGKRGALAEAPAKEGEAAARPHTSSTTCWRRGGIGKPSEESPKFPPARHRGATKTHPRLPNPHAERGLHPRPAHAADCRGLLGVLDDRGAPELDPPENAETGGQPRFQPRDGHPWPEGGGLSEQPAAVDRNTPAARPYTAPRRHQTRWSRPVTPAVSSLLWCSPPEVGEP